VRILQGNRSGESGIVTSVLEDGLGLDTHAVISMNTGNDHNNITVLVNNLRIKTESDAINEAEYHVKN